MSRNSNLVIIHLCTQTSNVGRVWNIHLQQTMKTYLEGTPISQEKGRTEGVTERADNSNHGTKLNNSDTGKDSTSASGVKLYQIDTKGTPV